MGGRRTCESVGNVFSRSPLSRSSLVVWRSMTPFICIPPWSPTAVVQALHHHYSGRKDELNNTEVSRPSEGGEREKKKRHFYDLPFGVLLWERATGRRKSTDIRASVGQSTDNSRECVQRFPCIRVVLRLSSLPPLLKHSIFVSVACF